MKTVTVAGVGAVITPNISKLYALTKAPSGKRIGIIGLDTSHSVAFTKLLNTADVANGFKNYRVVAAYAGGSADIEVSASRVVGFTGEVAQMGVKIVQTFPDLLKEVDVVIINTNDGRLHLEQAIAVLKSGKRTFINKPVAASLPDVLSIFDASKAYGIPVFSSSSLRYFNDIEFLSGQTSKVIGAETFSPAMLEKSHSDFFWYGIHGVEMLFTVMGTGCKQVSGIFNDDTDVVTGLWNDNRIGVFRGIRKGKHDYGGRIFGEKEVINITPEKGFKSLLSAIVNFFESGDAPVIPSETIEIYAFMEAAAESRRKNGLPVSLAETLKKATELKRNFTHINLNHH